MTDTGLEYSGPDLSSLTPSELEQRRRDIVLSFQTQYRGVDDPTIPMDLLHQLAFITTTLRRRNAGPPKVKRTPAAKGGRVGTVDDL